MWFCLLKAPRHFIEQHRFFVAGAARNSFPQMGHVRFSFLVLTMLLWILEQAGEHLHFLDDGNGTSNSMPQIVQCRVCVIVTP